MTPRLFLEPWPVVDGRPSLVGQGCTVEVQFWERHGRRRRWSRPRRNRYTHRIPADEPTGRRTRSTASRVRTLPLMATPTVNECRFPVDVVYTWVDGSDPEWNAAREQRHRRPRPAPPAPGRRAAGPASSPATSCATRCAASTCSRPGCARSTWSPAARCPTWLDRDHPASPWSDHAEILPADALPTFNSHAIETVAAPHPGPGRALALLQRRLLRSAGRSARRRCSARPGLSSVFFVPEHHRARPTCPTHRRGSRPPGTTGALLQEAFGVVTTNALAHAPYAVRTSVLAEIEERFAEVVARDRAVAVPLRHRHLDVELVRPALRAARPATRVRRRGRAPSSSTSPTATSTGSSASCCDRDQDFYLPRRPPRPRLPGVAARRDADHVPAGLLPGRRPWERD